MTTQEKIAAIQNILDNHTDNVHAVGTIQAHPGLSPLLTEAMNEALKADLQKVFALSSPGLPTATGSRRKKTG